ncbi:unnamed protein product, partial [Phaeothamnion confervicola]
MKGYADLPCCDAHLSAIFLLRTTSKLGRRSHRSFFTLKTNTRLSPRPTSNTTPLPPFPLPSEQRREHGSAETLLRQVLSARDDDVAAMVLLGRVRASLGGIAEAEQLYLAALRLDRSYEPAWRARAKLHAFQMRWKEAEEGFRHALALGSGSTTEDGGNEPAAAVTAAAAAAADARMGLARALLGVGDAVGAEAEYQRALEADPTNAAVHFDLGALAVKRRAPDEAAGHFARAATLDTRIDKAVVAQVYLTENYLAEAAAALGEVIASGAATVRNQ